MKSKKVAVLSPQPRTSGVVTYSHHLALGFRKLGHEAEVVTFTLSGKPSAAFTAGPMDASGKVRSGWGWTPLGFDRCERWDRAAEVLAEYDVIVVEEPRCAPMDKRAMRKIGGGDIKLGREVTIPGLMQDILGDDELPPYIPALANVGKKTKIAVTLHDPGYGTRLAPFLEHFMENVSPDLIVTHRDGSMESAAWAMPQPFPELRIEHLPYASRPAFAASLPMVAGTTGRYINNKGQPTLALAAALGFLPETMEVRIAGASPLGAGPNHTFLTYEGLTTEHGFRGKREGTDVTRGWPWRAVRKGQVVEYSGPYDDPVKACMRFGVHVCMTDPGFAGVGSLEYVQLEAIDAGCMLACPPSRLPKKGAPVVYQVNDEVWKLANAELKPVDDARRETARALGAALTTAAEDIRDDGKLVRDQAAHNRDVVREYHDPAEYAKKILEALA